MKILVILSIFLLSINANAYLLSSDSSGSELEQIVRKVEKVLKELEVTDVSLDVKDVIVTFQAEQAKTINGGLNILVFKAKREKKTTSGNEMVFKFSLNRNISPGFKEEDIDEELTRVLWSATKNIQDVKDSSLKMEEYSVTVSFVIEKVTDTGFDIPLKITPVSINGSKAWRNKAVHSIKLVLNPN